MWSILTDALPEYISIGDAAIWRVNTDFRVWLRVGQLLADYKIQSPQGEQEALVRSLYQLILPEGEKVHGHIFWGGFIEGVSKFYEGPSDDQQKDPGEPEPAKPANKRQFDFEYDAEYIYQGFASFYNIRLQELDYMHWWEFLALFNGLMLNEGNSFYFVLSVRNRKTSDVPKARLADYIKMKKIFALPEDEKITATQNAVYDNLEKMWAETPETELE